MDWMARRIAERLDPTVVLAGASDGHCARHRVPPAGRRAPRRGGALRAGTRLPLRAPRSNEGAPQAPAGAGRDARDVRLRRHRGGDGEALGRAGGAGMDRQERLPHQPAARLVADAVGDVRRPRRRRLRPARTSAAAATARSVCGACPTQAFAVPGVVDARRCIAYQSIENQGAGPAAAAPRVQRTDLRLRRLPGGLPLEPPSPARGRRPLRPAPAVGALSGRGGRAPAPRFDRLAAGMALARARYDGLRRNALYAIGTARDAAPARGKLVDDAGPDRQRRGARGAGGWSLKGAIKTLPSQLVAARTALRSASRLMPKPRTTRTGRGATLTSPERDARPREAKVERPPLYEVLLHNDDYTTQEFVVYVLMKFFQHDARRRPQDHAARPHQGHRRRRRLPLRHRRDQGAPGGAIRARARDAACRRRCARVRSEMADAEPELETGHSPRAGRRDPPRARVLGARAPAAGAARRRQDRRRHQALRRLAAAARREAGERSWTARSSPLPEEERERAQPTLASRAWFSAPSTTCSAPARPRPRPQRARRAVLASPSLTPSLPQGRGHHPARRGQLHLPRHLQAAARPRPGQAGQRRAPGATGRDEDEERRRPIRWRRSPST